MPWLYLVNRPRHQPRRVHDEHGGEPQPRRVLLPPLASAGVPDHAPDGTARRCYFVPPNLDPIDRNYDPLVWRTAGLLGHAMALALEEDGRSGVLQNALYDYYWPGYEDSAPLGHNTVTLLTEAASVRVASPIEVPAEQLTGGRGFPDHQPSTTFPSPWPGGRWTLRNIVDYNLSAARGLINGAARYRGDLVRNFYRMGKRQVELGAKGGPFAFIIPHDQFDPHAARKLEELLIQGAVEIRRTRAVPRCRHRLSEWRRHRDDGAALRAYAKTLLEVQQYPVRRLAPGAASIGHATLRGGRCRCR